MKFQFLVYFVRNFGFFFLIGVVFCLSTSAHAEIYKCWANGGKGKAYYSDSKAGQNCITFSGATPQKLVAKPTADLPEKIFASSSFWTKPIPIDVKLDPNTLSLTSEFIRQKTQYYNNVTINTTSYASPVYLPDSKVANVKVAFDDCQKKKYADREFVNMMSAVPIPSYAKPADGNDSEMTIYDPASQTIWELWKAKRDSNGNWSACWGGKMSYATSNIGVFQKGYGTTATGLPFMGGQITAAELNKGEIKHAIGISMVEVAAAHIISWPANRSDGYNPKNLPNRITEGQRFRLDPKVDVDSLKMGKAGKIIAKAAQKYGFIVWDKAGSVSIRAQNTYSYTSVGLPDPYGALFEQKPRYAVLNGFPWERLQFLPINYGQY